MEFDQPDIEDLIQSDLNSEMNKILNQSSEMNNESIGESHLSEPLNDIFPESSLKKELESMAFPSESSLKKELESMAFPSGSANVHSAEGGKSLILDDDKTNEDDKTELSNFSVDSVTGACPTPDVSESNDLSNLAWLSTVDVQQELQKVSQSDQGFQKNYEQTPPKPTFTASSSGCVVYGSTSCSTTDPAQHLPHNGMPQPRTRFTPIQPNLNNIDTTQQQQPYFLHHPPHHHHQQHHQQQQRNNQQLLQPMQQPMVDRTSPNHRYNHYRPYPPPPYTAGIGLRAGYDNFHHLGRYHRTQQQRVFPKPVYSYSCLIAMSLRKSKTGALPVSDIYSYMMENFPYFKTAPDGWKNSVRHNLSLNKCFEKVEKPNGSQRKGCLWALNPAKASKMEEELQKWKRKDPESIRKSMSNPDEFDREIEELRRADEETARRRMLSMSGHGLSIPFFHPHLHPGGSSSLPSTPHHYHHPPPHFHMRQSTTPTHRYNPQQHQQQQQVCGYPATDQQRSQHPPRQLFAHMQQHNMDGGGGTTGNSLPQPSVHEQPMSVREQPISVHEQPMTSAVESLHPTLTSDASGFLSALENNGSSSGHPDLTDLESSLTDLSAFQGVSWDEAACALASPASAQHDFFDEQPTSSSSGHRHPSSTTTELSTALSDHGAGEPPPSNGANADSTYGALARFAGDFSYITTNSKTVMLH